MENKKQDDCVPVFLINGFLESGKTAFITFTMDQDYFQTDGTTLLLICEEGDLEYEEAFLAQNKTIPIIINELSDMTTTRLEELSARYNPERILLEWNGMWNMDELKLPSNWEIHQQITLIDMSTYQVYGTNLKPLLYSMVQNSDMVICNRCNQEEDYAAYRRELKAMCPKGEIVMEGNDGELDQIEEEDLPYDMQQEIIKISPEAYGIWYLDCMERSDRYQDRVVEFTAMVLKTPELPKNYFVPGRMAMTCCEDDMSFLGFITKSREARNLETKQWVTVRAKIAYEYWKDYEGQGPVLYAESVQPSEPIPGFVQF